MDPNTLTPEDKAELDRVLQLSVLSMTAHDRAILRARQDYLTDAQKEDFKEVLNSTEDQDETNSTVDGELETEETPAKPAKK